jgi:N-methylhydantoinase A
METAIVDRAGLAGSARSGPLIVQEYDATCLVPKDWTGSVDEFGNIRLSRNGTA